MTELTPELIAKIVTVTGTVVVGITIGLLNKLGIVSFHKQKTNGGKAPIPMNCPNHIDISHSIKSLTEVQIQQGEILKAHSASLADSKKDCREINKAIGEINVSIGVLVDRSARRQSGE